MSEGRLVADPGYRAVQQIPGIGPTLAAVFVAEIGDVHRFPGPGQLASWAGLTPKHHESDTHVHPISAGPDHQARLPAVRWAAIESVQALGPGTGAGRLKRRVGDRRGRNIGKTAAARQQLTYVYYAMRDGHVRSLHGSRVAA